MLQFLHDTVPVRALVVSSGSQFWLIGEKRDGQEGPRLAHGVDGNAGGAGLLWMIGTSVQPPQTTGQSLQGESLT